jgi:hypothetical protein
MLLHAISLAGESSARAEMGDELNDKSQAMARYRQSMLLLVPLVVPIVALRQRTRHVA